MKDNFYIQPRNGGCPVCSGTLNSTQSGNFKVCIDCGSIFKVVHDDLKFGGESDVMLELTRRKE